MNFIQRQDGKFEIENLVLSDNGMTVAIGLIIGGGGTEITTGIKGDIQIPFNCSLKNVVLLADQSGDIVVDIQKCTYANFPSTTSICGGSKPTITSNDKSEDDTLSGWTTTITAGDILRFSIDSVSTITRLTISLTALKN